MVKSWVKIFFKRNHKSSHCKYHLKIHLTLIKKEVIIYLTNYVIGYYKNLVIKKEVNLVKIVVIGTLKGGTGKTTVLFNAAGVLAENSRVLAIDFDPQCNLSSACGINVAKQKRLSSKDIFDQERAYKPEEIVVKSPVKELPNLDLMPSHMLMTAVEFSLVNTPAREGIFRSYIEDHRAWFEQYDYILCDTNPSVGIVNQNAFAAADSIVLVTDVSEDGIMGVELFTYLWGKVRKALRMEDNVKALVINLADRRTSLTKELKEYCEDNEDLLPLLLDAIVYSKVVYKEARIEHKPVNVLPGRTAREAAQDIRKVVKALEKREVF